MSKEFYDGFECNNVGQVPPPSGKLEIVVLGAPVSVQSTKAVRDTYLQQIWTLLAKFDYVLMGQLMLEVVWFVPAKSRYETDAKADIDNCLKPIIDAFTGPNGLFINDCQLKGLYICWRTSNSESERLVFTFEYDPDQYCPREGLAFLRLEKGLCCPVNTTWPKVARVAWISAMSTGGFFKVQLEKLGVTYLALAGMQGGSQPFHITRTGGFPLLTAKTFVAGASDA
ncbi:MAG: RusA family crossover junction endodeoxyribonuclease [Candidatus Obscuribacterales bacterium]|nr:RusA family crossover junction endodeoxyribonuclease [Candidatus Obscuribacterales bacterium]